MATPTVTPQAVGEAVRRVIETPLVQAGFFVEQVSVTPAGRRLVVRVLLDAVQVQAPPLSLDQVTQASTQISLLLDQDAAFNRDLGPASYVLECSTPGVSRPLTQLRHWQRATQRLVRIECTDGGSMLGRLLQVDPQAGVQVRPDGAVDTAVTMLAWQQIRQGQVQVEFRRTDHPDQPETDPDRGESELGEPPLSDHDDLAEHAPATSKKDEA